MNQQDSSTILCSNPRVAECSSGLNGAADAGRVFSGGRIWTRGQQARRPPAVTPQRRSGEHLAAQDLSTKITRTVRWPFAVNNGSREWARPVEGALPSASGQPGERRQALLATMITTERVSGRVGKPLTDRPASPAPARLSRTVRRSVRVTQPSGRAWRQVYFGYTDGTRRKPHVPSVRRLGRACA